MFAVIQRKKLADKAATIEVFTPSIASVMLPGQFVTIRITDRSPWIAMPVSSWNVEAGTITLFIDKVEDHTQMLATNTEISMLYDLEGPLGIPAEITLYNNKELLASRLLYVADGVGAVIAVSQMKWLADIGCKADVIVSAKSKEELLFTKELEKFGNNIYFATQDGSLGFQGPEAQLLEMLLQKDQTPYDLIVTVGSLASMKAVSITSQDFGIPVIANFTQQLSESADAHNGFKVNIEGDMKNVANEGPEFHALSLDFEQALSSLSMNLRDWKFSPPSWKVSLK